MRPPSLRATLIGSHLASVVIVLGTVYLGAPAGQTVDLGAALLVGVIVSLGLGAAVAKLGLQPLVELTAAARRLARGDFGALVVQPSRDELGAHGLALSSLATELEARIGDLTGERDRLSAMLSAMVEGVLVVGPDGKVAVANRSAEQILEIEGGIAGRTATEAIRHPTARKVIEAAVKDGAARDEKIEGLGPAARSVVISVQPLGGGGAVAVLHDVTQLERLETIRRDFVSNVSHELQTPVASIQSYSESLLDGAFAEPETARRFAEVIHRNAVRMGRLVKDLLELSRLEARSPADAKREPIPLLEAVEDSLETMERRAEDATVRIDVEVPAELRVSGDPDGLVQMVINLVDNALKYGRRGGTVRIGAAREGAFVVLWVADDGPGIESRHLPRIFERFYRIDEGRSRERGGTGLGLAIVKHLAESMGGGVEVESEVGKGARFIVRLPAADTSADRP